MTEVELFPRGNAATAPANSETGSINARRDAPKLNSSDFMKHPEEPDRKRKSLGDDRGVPRAGTDGERDWLFGEPKPKVSQSGKRPRSESSRITSGAGQLGGKIHRTTTSSMGGNMIVERHGFVPKLEMVEFWKLTEGIITLGIVSMVKPNDLFISLPAGLLGAVTKREASDLLFSKAVGHDDADEALKDFVLRDMFHKGQVLRCCIISLEKKDGSNRIHLSLRASLINRGLTRSQLRVEQGVYGTVSSVEDHGYVICLGLDDVNAFLPTSNAPDGGLKEGQPVEVVVKVVKAAARMLTLSADKGLVASAITKGSHFDLHSLKPGMLVDAIVDRVVLNGMLVTFLGCFRGCVDHDNMSFVSTDDANDPKSWRAHYKDCSKSVRARILLVDYSKQVVRLTLRPHLVAMRAASGLPNVGDKLVGQVTRIDARHGILLKIPRREGDDTVAADDDPAPADDVGAYVYPSMLKGGKADKTQNYKLNQEVRCRIMETLLVPGWAKASLRPCDLSGAAIQSDKLRPGAVVEGVVRFTGKFGMVVALGDQLEVMVTKAHMGDTFVYDPRGRYKAGEKVKGKLLELDGKGKGLMTIKQDMVQDKNPPLTSFDEAKVGVCCVGYATKAVSSRVHVAFYNGVHGVLHARELERYGIYNPPDSFGQNQAVACVVRSCDTHCDPPKLNLEYDVASKMGQDKGKTGRSKKADEKSKLPTFAVRTGDIVRGVVSPLQRLDNSVVVDIFPIDTLGQLSQRPAHIPHLHLGDQGLVCNAIVAATLEAGKELSELVVVDVDKSGVVTVSMKPLLILSAWQHKAGSKGGKRIGKMPYRDAGLKRGSRLVGYIARVGSHSSTIRFMGNMSAVGPRLPQQVDGNGATKAHPEGDTVRCVVSDVTPERVSVIFEPSLPPTRGHYVRSLLSETFMWTVTKSMKANSSLTHDEVVKSWTGFEFGDTITGRVMATKKYGIVLKAVAGSAKKRELEGDADDPQLLLCPPEHAPDHDLEEGLDIKVRIIGVDMEKKVWDVTMDGDLVKAGRAKCRRMLQPLSEGQSTSAKIVLAKPEAKYAVAASSDARLFVVQVADFHCPHRTNSDVGWVTELHGETVRGNIAKNDEPGRSPWAYADANPYRSATVLVPEDFAISSRKRLRERIPEGLAPLQEQISEQDVVQQGSNRTVDTKRVRRSDTNANAVGSAEVKSSQATCGTKVASESCEGSKAAEAKSKKTSKRIEESYTPGDFVTGRILKNVKHFNPPCLMVGIKGGGMGRVCITELADEDAWSDDPLTKFRNRQTIRCRVLRPLPAQKHSAGGTGKEKTGFTGPVQLSLRPSRLDLDLTAEEAITRKGSPAEGSIVQCYVADTNEVGCFLVLPGSLQGRVMLKDLADTFLQDPAMEFPQGRLVAGRVLTEDESGQIALTLKRSAVVTEVPVSNSLTWESPSLEKGLKVEGIVDSVSDFGVFIKMKDSKVRGMCHRNQASDQPITDLRTVYSVGDRVKAVVLVVKKEEKKVVFGLKGSYFEGDPDTSCDEEDYADLEKIEETDSSSKLGMTSGGGKKIPTLAGSRSTNTFNLNFGTFGGEVAGNDGSDEDSQEDSDDDEDPIIGKTHRARKKARERREEEQRIAAKERALMDEDAAPETAGDFERLVIASPNDSFLWVKYMAFNLSLADIEAARAIGERALKKISFRQEQERFNVWVSLLNLEHKFGTAATLKKATERACQSSNPKKVYLHVAEMHEQSEQTERSEEVFQTAARKFRHSKKVWMAFQLARLRRGDNAGAQDMLQRSLQSLARHKHVAVISRFAQNQFEHGSVEQGRIIFEGLMASYPKRLDLWNVYVDKEIKGGDVRAARNLLERLTVMAFNAKRMKGVFKKYMQFEMDHGDEASVEAVKAKATAYVTSLTG